MSRIAMLVVAAALASGAATTRSAPTQIAVASNFAETATVLAERFEQASGHPVTLVFGSTGRHYAQIKNGAPFKAFLAADSRRPRLLEQEGLALPGSRFTYAVGRIILWSPDAGLVDPDGAVLETDAFRYLAIANPKLAPYGKAAQEVLEALGLWHRLRGRMVRGESISQAFQFVRSGNAQLGFVASSQLAGAGPTPDGSSWEVPQSLYTPIEQQAVLLVDDATASAFLDSLQSDEARSIIERHGYSTR